MQPYLDHVLTDAEMVEAEMHLDECEQCRRRYRFEESLRVYVRKAVAEQMPPELRQKLVPRSSASPLRRVARALVDVAGRAQVVARDEARRQRAGALVRDARPGRAGEQDGVEADAAVARGDDVAGVGPPVGDDAVDGARVEAGPVGERDDGRLGIRRAAPRGRSAGTRPGRAPSRGSGRSRPAADARR